MKKNMLFVFTVSTVSLSFLDASVGAISAMNGGVSIIRNGVSSNAFKDFELENGDLIETTNNGKAQIIFIDQTTVRLGKNTKFEIANFSFGADQTPEADLKIKKGFFSAVTGEIGKIAKDRFKLETKTSTIGIRGTHFQGLIGENDEDIACLDGSIFVETAGETIEVAKSEMLTIRDGQPEGVRSIKSIDVKNMEEKASLDDSRAEVQASLSSLQSIRDSDLKMAEYQKLFTQLSILIDQYEQLANFYKSPMIISNNDNSIKLGVLAKNQIEFLDSDLISTKLEQLNNANLGNVYFETTSKTDLNMNSLPHWNGNSSGSIKYYEGSVLFVGDANPDNQDDKNFISQNGIQKVSIVIDTLNKTSSGSFDYLGSPVKFQTSGKGAVTNSNFAFYSNNVLENISSKNQLVFDQVKNGFVGNSLYAGVTLTVPNYFSISKDQQDNSIANFGGLIATQVSETKLTAKEIGNSDRFSWGYWADEVNSENVYGGWIKPNMIETGADKIAELKNSGFTANYSGDIIGTVKNLDGEIAKMENGKFSFDVDFGANKINGQLGFDAGTDNYNMAFTSKDAINGNDFVFNKTSTTDGSFIDLGTNKPDYMYGSGKFYGSNAESIGGGFTAGFNNGNIATGAIYGNK